MKTSSFGTNTLTKSRSKATNENFLVNEKFYIDVVFAVFSQPSSPDCERQLERNEKLSNHAHFNVREKRMRIESFEGLKAQICLHV